MKRLLIIMVSLLALCCCLAACSGGLSSKDVTGTWHPVLNVDVPINYEFDRGGTLRFVSTIGGSQEALREGTWEIEGDEIVINLPAGDSSFGGISLRNEADQDVRATIDADGYMNIPFDSGAVKAEKKS